MMPNRLLPFLFSSLLVACLTSFTSANDAPNVSASPCGRSSVCQWSDFLYGEAYAGGNRVWQAERENRVRLVDLTTCQIDSVCSTPPPYAGADLAFDGAFLYQHNLESGLLHKIQPGTCQIVASCVPPGDPAVGGLTWDGQYLWRVDAQMIWQFTPPPDCAVVGSCVNPTGVAADGLTFCSGSVTMLGSNNSIYTIDTSTCQVVGSCELEVGAEGSASGLTSDGVSTLFVDITFLGDIGHIYRLNFACGVPTATDPTSWGRLKTLFR
jgi:hypothetical protein